MLRHSIFFAFFLFSFNCALTAQVKILFDATKAETAANADWTIDADKYNVGFGTGVATIGGTGTEANPQRIPTPAQSGINALTTENYWSGGLSSWGVECVKKGYSVESLPIGSKITYGELSNIQDLSLYQVFVLCEPNIAFTSAEKTAILKFVQNGGSLFMVADHDMSDRNFDGIDSPSIFNDLMNNNTIKNNPFGFNFNLDDISQTSTNIISTGNNPVINGPYGNIVKIKTSGGSSMTINNTLNPVVQGLIYKNNTSKLKNEVLAVTSQFEKGKVFAIGDSSIPDDGTGDPNDVLYDGWLGDADGNHRKLIMNATVWLATIQIDSIKATVKSIANNSCSDSKNGAIELAVSGGNKSYSYLWSNGATTNPAIALSAGSYNVTISSAGAPPLVLNSLKVTAPENLKANIAKPLTLNCKSTEITLSANAVGGTAPYNFQWSSGNPVITNPGNYTVSVTDKNGCKTIATTTVSQDVNVPVVLVQFSNLSCANPKALLGASSTNGHLLYEWKGPQNFISNKKDTVALLPGTYTMQAKDTVNGCIVEKTVTIVENNGNAPMAIKLLSKRDASDIPSGFIIIEVKNGTPPYQYQWKNEKGKVVGSNSASITDIDKGTYTCEVTDANGCKISITATIYKVLGAIDAGKYQTLLVYPNPAQDHIFINSEETLPFTIYSVNGLKMMEGKTNERLEINHFPAGLYLIRLVSATAAVRFFIKI